MKSSVNFGAALPLTLLLIFFNPAEALSLVPGLPPWPCNFPTESLRFYDLSYSVSGNTLFFPGTKNFSLTKDKEGDQQGGYWYSSSSFCMGEHGGTHLDAPYHFSKTGHTVDEIPTNRLINVRAEVVDVSEFILDRSGNIINADYALTVAHLIEHEEKYGRIPDGAVVLMYSGWSGFYPDRETYLGIQGGDESSLRFPGCSEAAIKWLVDERKIVGFGLDTPSVDVGRSKTYPVHVYGASKQVYNLENVANLHLIKPVKGPDGVLRKRPLRLIVAPMKIVGGTGAPCRILAFDEAP